MALELSRVVNEQLAPNLWDNFASRHDGIQVPEGGQEDLFQSSFRGKPLKVNLEPWAPILLS